MSAARNILFGIVAGALAVLIFHQGMYYLLATSGMGVSGQPWRTNPVPLWPDLMKALSSPAVSVPTIASQMVWGAMWGALFGLIVDRMPGGPVWVKGLIFALIFPMLLSSWLILPLLRGTPIFSGFLADYNPVRLRTGFLLNGLAFGLGLGIIYSLLPGRRAEAYS